MRQRESRRPLHGLVCADDAVFDGARVGKPERGSANNATFMAAAELDDNGHPWRVRFDAIADDTGKTFATWAKSASHTEVHRVTEGCAIFNAAGAGVAAAGAVLVGKRKSSALAPSRWVNTLISNAKRTITPGRIITSTLPRTAIESRRGTVTDQSPF